MSRLGILLMRHRLKILALLAVLTNFACSLAAQTAAPKPAGENLVETRSPASAGSGPLTLGECGDRSHTAHARVQLDLSALDKSVSPSANFFTFATGNCAGDNPIPAHYASWGIS